MLLIATLASVLAVVASQLAGDPKVAMGFLWLAMACAAMALGPATAAIQVLAPDQFRAQAAVVLYLLIFIVAFMGIPITGFLTDSVFADPKRIGDALIVLALAFGTLAVAVVWHYRSHYVATARARPARRSRCWRRWPWRCRIAAPGVTGRRWSARCKRHSAPTIGSASCPSVPRCCVRASASANGRTRPLHFEREGITTLTDVAYGEHGDFNKLDIVRPAGPIDPTLPGRPVLLHIHGGAWMIGQKGKEALPLIRPLAQRGWVVAT